MKIVECFFCGDRVVLPNSQVAEMEQQWVDGGHSFEDFKISCPKCKEKGEPFTITLRPSCPDEPKVWEQLEEMCKLLAPKLKKLFEEGKWQEISNWCQEHKFNFSVALVENELWGQMFFYLEDKLFSCFQIKVLKPVISKIENTNPPKEAVVVKTEMVYCDLCNQQYNKCDGAVGEFICPKCVLTSGK